MNLSGTAVEAVLRKNGMSPADLVVVLDDADLELGRIRVRGKGSSGGHRGLQSIVERLGSQDFPRVRIGIGRKGAQNLVDQVLSPLSPAERELIVPAVERAADAVQCVLEAGVDAAMNRFNATG
jgi:PTH1 family peptidyl-tRNA hydrolase